MFALQVCAMTRHFYRTHWNISPKNVSPAILRYDELNFGRTFFYLDHGQCNDNTHTMWNLSKPSQIDRITILKKLFDYEISIFNKDSKKFKNSGKYIVRIRIPDPDSGSGIPEI